MIAPKALFRAAALSALALLAFLVGCVEDKGANPPSPWGVFIDERDGRAYKTTEIGGVTWMAENLNYAMRGSFCFDDDTSNCAAYGRLYDWDGALEACPIGWHLPGRDEWNSLIVAAGGAGGLTLDDVWCDEVDDGYGDGDECEGVAYVDSLYRYDLAGKKLKSKTGWANGRGGTDDYWFSARSGGYYNFEGDVIDIGLWAVWWSSAERWDGRSYYRFMYWDNAWVMEHYGRRGTGLSVRCARDFTEL